MYYFVTEKISHLLKIKMRIYYTNVLMEFLERRSLIKDVCQERIKMIQTLHICLLKRNNFSLKVTQA